MFARLNAWIIGTRIVVPTVKSVILAVLSALEETLTRIALHVLMVLMILPYSTRDLIKLLTQLKLGNAPLLKVAQENIFLTVILSITQITAILVTRLAQPVMTILAVILLVLIAKMPNMCIVMPVILELALAE